METVKEVKAESLKEESLVAVYKYLLNYEAKNSKASEAQEIITNESN